MYKIYAIASLNHKYVYVGLTSDLEKRLKRHNGGLEKTTRPHAPYKLVYSENAVDRPAARLREKYLKGRSGKRFLYKIIQESFQQLVQYKE